MIDKQLIEDVQLYINDPYGFVMWGFHWNEGDLAGHAGPEAWQAEILKAVRDGILTVEGALRIAVASGHGVGKTALVSWIILWFMSTRPHCAGVVTANTKNQLQSKTWRELAVWKRRLINGHWFNYTGSRIEHVNFPDTWFIMAIAWSKDKPEAFAGLHAKDVLVIYDEASAIEDVIWEVSEGAMTTVGAMWFCFGNPTRNTGRFRDCFGRQAHRWKTYHVDSREVTISNKAQIAEWIEDYGEDSDFVRVRVRGVFPRAGSQQFISADTVQMSFNRMGQRFGGVIIGVDVARFGDDRTILLRRTANKLLSYAAYPETSVTRVVSLVAEDIETYDPIGVFIDGAGVGGGVVDGLVTLGFDVVEVNGGESASDKDRYFNLRAEMWGLMRKWLERRAVLGQYDRELSEDLIGIEYGFDEKNRIQLERKKDMKKRGLRSPDIADALALTFAHPVADVELAGPRMNKAGQIAEETNPHEMHPIVLPTGLEIRLFGDHRNVLPEAFICDRIVPVDGHRLARR